MECERTWRISQILPSLEKKWKASAQQHADTVKYLSFEWCWTSGFHITLIVRSTLSQFSVINCTTGIYCSIVANINGHTLRFSRQLIYLNLVILGWFLISFMYRNRQYLYSRYWTGTNLLLRLMRGNLFNCKNFDDIPPHEPPVKTSSSSIPRTRIFLFRQTSYC